MPHCLWMTEALSEKWQLVLMDSFFSQYLVQLFQ